MKLYKLFEETNFNPTEAIPVSQSSFIKTASGANTPPPVPYGGPNDKSGEQSAIAVPAIRLNGELNQNRASKFFNAPLSSPDKKLSYGEPSSNRRGTEQSSELLNRTPKLMPGRDELTI